MLYTEFQSAELVQAPSESGSIKEFKFFKLSKRKWRGNLITLEIHRERVVVYTIKWLRLKKGIIRRNNS